MECRFCGKKIENFVELNAHELECWKKKCEEERIRKEKAEIERKRAEEEKRLEEEVTERGAELVFKINEYIVAWNKFKSDFEHTKYFHKWKDLELDCEDSIRFKNGSTIAKVKTGTECVRSKRGEEQIKSLCDVLPYYWFEV